MEDYNNKAIELGSPETIKGLDIIKVYGVVGYELELQSHGKEIVYEFEYIGEVNHTKLIQESILGALHTKNINNNKEWEELNNLISEGIAGILDMRLKIITPKLEGRTNDRLVFRFINQNVLPISYKNKLVEELSMFNRNYSMYMTILSSQESISSILNLKEVISKIDSSKYTHFFIRTDNRYETNIKGITVRDLE